MFGLTIHQPQQKQFEFELNIRPRNRSIEKQL